ncbi:MAG: cytochrome-c peroxidase [Bacteroidetes bacterium]|nr:MAG: cytochrome-c peroxidase [Bacteroidota bacterium]
MRHLLLTTILVSFLSACQPDEPVDTLAATPYEWTLPPGFPQPLESADHPTTVERVALGKELFYDPILSEDGTVSCASCHVPELAFAHNQAVSPGVHGRLGLRNSATLTNVGYASRLNKDGGVPKLDIQALVPISDVNEMNLSMEEAIARLNVDAEYRQQFERAYGTEANLYNVPRALAAFMRTLISGESPYDRFVRGEQSALTAAQQAGMSLFFSERLACASCHSGFNFTNDSFVNNGLYLDYGADPGRQRVTIDTADVGAFRVPTLRNIALTAPYMHDGSLADLKAVVAHYNRGGQARPLQDERIRPLGLSEQETDQLIAFLQALTDTAFVYNPQFR